MCHNNGFLFKLWCDILLHNDEIDKRISKYFIDQIRKNISNDDAVALGNHLKKLPKNSKNCWNDVSEVFRNHTLFLLENPIRSWENQDIIAIKKLLQDGNLNWQSNDIILSLEFISHSHSLKLLNIFPELLDDWFRNSFSDNMKRIPRICVNWFTLLLIKLGATEKNIIFLAF